MQWKPKWEKIKEVIRRANFLFYDNSIDSFILKKNQYIIKEYQYILEF